VANTNAPDFSTPERPPAPRLAQTMAYGSGAPAANGLIMSQLHRLRRNVPYTRAGIVQAPIPQFKGLTFYTQAEHIPTAANPNPSVITNLPPVFRQTMTPTRIRRAVTSVPNVVTT
jgi:hypothetical protein